VDPASRDLIKATHDALTAAIDLVKPGARFRDIGDVITKHITRAG
jgi:methionyl aminopeptidase